MAKMGHTDKNTSGYFEIAREPSTISFESFWNNYVAIEKPVIIENVGSDWPANTLWSESYLQKRLAEEPSAKAAFLWYWMEKNALSEDYRIPDIVDKAVDDHTVFPRSQMMRIWVHKQGNLSSWHYDSNMASVFNVQITGRKKWSLISPDTPLPCYPYTNFAILDGKGDKVFRKKVYARFDLNPGEMLYLPPLWFHQVEAYEEENINLNWVFTKQETQVISATFKREFERYYLAYYFSRHPVQFYRTIFQKLNALLPNYMRIKWQYPELIGSPYKPTLVSLLIRILKEALLVVKVLVHLNKIAPYKKNIQSVKHLKH